MDENKLPDFSEETPKEIQNNEQASEQHLEEAAEQAGINMQIDNLGEAKPSAKKSVGKEIFEWVQAIVVAFVVAMFLRSFVFTMVEVDGSSMEPTLHHQQRLLVTRFDKTYEQGDIIIFRPVSEPERPYIKRVIATEGQTVSFDFDTGNVYVDGEALSEAYIADSIDSMHFGSFNPYTKPEAVVPEGHIFVMGDNRNNSSDSRLDDVGMVNVDSVIGKAVLRWWPVTEFTTNFSGLS